jgi:hypothetical protein
MILILACLLLTSFAVNFFHWSAVGQRFGYYPARGWVRTVFTGCNILLGVLAALVVFRIIPDTPFICFLVGWGVVVEIYCIRRRREAVIGARSAAPN